MARRQSALRVYCFTEEAQIITAQASRAGLSVSDYMRRVAMGFPIPSREDAQARQELRKVNADLARLGNLLKMAIGPGENETITALLVQIAETQAELKNIVSQIKEINHD